MSSRACGLAAMAVAGMLVAAPGPAAHATQASPSCRSEQRGFLPLEGAAIDTRLFRYERAIPGGPAGLTFFLLDAAALAHSRALADIRIVDSQGRQVPWLREELDDPLEIVLDPIELVETRTERGRSTSRYTVKLPHAGLPPAKLILTTTERVFDRTITVKAAPLHRSRWRSSRHGVLDVRSWQHSDPAASAEPARLELPTLASDVVEILVDEGQNERLALSSPKLLLPAHRIRFVRASDAGPLRLVYGNDRAPAPSYDLELLGCELLGASASEVALEGETPNETSGGTVAERRLFWGALLVSVLAVLVLINRLLAKRP